MPPTLTNKLSCIKEKHSTVWNRVKILHWPSIGLVSQHFSARSANFLQSWPQLKTPNTLRIQSFNLQITAITCVVGVRGVLQADLLAVKQTKTHMWHTSDLTVLRVSIPCSGLLVRPGAYESVGKGDLWSVAAQLSAISGAWLCCGSTLLTVSYPPPPSPAVSAA